MALPPDVAIWIEHQAGGRVVNVEQQVRWRPHHFVRVELPDGSTIELLARSERQAIAAGSAFQEHFDLAHEARVLEALQGRGLKIPRFLGFNAEHRVILMERLRGTNDLSDASGDEARRQVMYEYIEELARLHSLDIESMHLSGISIPRTAEEIAFAGKFRFMEHSFDARRAALRPEPLLELGIWWLHAHVPRSERPVRFLQGDTGPGQFMFADDHLTGLIDWELAHVGDPMLDLGVARMRNMLYPTGPLREPIDHYAEVTGTPIDWPALSFYTVMSMLLTPMGVAPSVQRPSPRTEGMLAQFGWDATLRRGLCDALAEALGIDIDPPDLRDSAPPERRSLLDYLTRHLEVNCAPIAADGAGRYAIDSAIAIAHTLQLESRVGTALLADDLDDMAAVLGRRPHDRDEGLARIAELVAEDPEGHLVELVSVFARIERRREHLLEPMMISQASGAFERLAPKN